MTQTLFVLMDFILFLSDYVTRYYVICSWADPGGVSYANLPIASTEIEMAKF